MLAILLLNAVLCGWAIITAVAIWAALVLKARTDTQLRLNTAIQERADHRDLEDAPGLRSRLAELEALLAAVPVDALRRTYQRDISDDPQDTLAIETWLAQCDLANAQPGQGHTAAFADLRQHFGHYFDAIDDVDAWVREQRGGQPADPMDAGPSTTPTER